MSLSTKRFLTVAALTNPLLWLVAALAVALATVGLGVLVMWSIYRYLRDEWDIPTRPKLVPRIDLGPAVPPPPFGVELPKPTPVTAERRVAVLAAERDDAPVACAQAEEPVAVRTTSKAPKKPRKAPAPPAKARTRATATKVKAASPRKKAK